MPKGMVVNLSADKSLFGGFEDVTLHVKITNPADRPIRLLKWLVPAQDMDAPLFIVTRDGKPVAYIGKMVTRPAPTEQDYITALQNLCKSVHGRSLFGSCFEELCLKPGLICSPQA